MSITLLLDLDDTLLGNDVHTFLPEYMGAFARHVSDLISPADFLHAMQLGTQAMIFNRRSDCTLQEAFEGAFFTRVKVDPGDFYALADRYYEEIFPTLRRLTTPFPGAVAMVDDAVRRGARLAITTNPLFPRTANLQRLDWAGLSADKYPFEVIGGFESFHFAKPDPAFYAEALAKMGWPSGPIIVVGDDLERDIRAGNQLGLQTYWLNKPGMTLPKDAAVPAAEGDHMELTRLLDSAAPEDLEPDFSSPTACIAILRSTPAVLDTLTRDLPTPVWRLTPRPGEWSLTEITCHLHDVEEEVNLVRLRRLLDTHNPFLAGQDTDRWVEERNYSQCDGRQELVAFFQRRIEVLQILEELPEEDWQRPARHAIFGPTRLIELVRIMAAHDRLHVQQIFSLVNSGLD